MGGAVGSPVDPGFGAGSQHSLPGSVLGGGSRMEPGPQQHFSDQTQFGSGVGTYQVTAGLVTSGSESGDPGSAQMAHPGSRGGSDQIDHGSVFPNSHTVRPGMVQVVHPGSGVVADQIPSGSIRPDSQPVEREVIQVVHPGPTFGMDQIAPGLVLTSSQTMSSGSTQIMHPGSGVRLQFSQSVADEPGPEIGRQITVAV
jgi:hypothetical protein